MDTPTRLQASYFRGADAPPLLNSTIGRCLEEIAGRFADREALVVLHQGVRWTYAEYLE